MRGAHKTRDQHEQVCIILPNAIICRAHLTSKISDDNPMREILHAQHQPASRIPSPFP
jgi:hypothetical protein